jgi:hypothetical protein
MRTPNAILLRVTVAALLAIPFTVLAVGQTTTPPPPATKKPTVATPRMIDEAIQRSQARTVKERDQRVPEQFGSEEPFTYVPK